MVPYGTGVSGGLDLALLGPHSLHGVTVPQRVLSLGCRVGAR
jgi:hypothetical protein